MFVIFYDGECPLCHRAVRFVVHEDKKKQFYFAPLQGETAKQKLIDLRCKHPDLDTLVLDEHDHLLIEGRAALRILWLLGGKWKSIGWLSFLPSPLFDAIYRIIAKYRYRLLSKKKPLTATDLQGRLLP